MIIVVEGPDRCGKSTMVKQLSKKLGYPVFKPSRREPTAVTVESGMAEGLAIMSMLESTRPDIIFDRYFPSEYAYGVANNRQIDFEGIMDLDDRLSSLPHLCVLLSEQHVEDYEGDPEHWSSVRSGYDRFVNLSSCRWLLDPSTERAVMDAVGHQAIDLSDLFPALSRATATGELIENGLVRVRQGSWSWRLDPDKMQTALDRIRREQGRKA